MIEEEEDEDVQQMNTKDKLSSNSEYILESDSDDEQIMFNHIDKERDHKPMNPKVNVKNTCPKIPISTGRQFKRPKTPKVGECSVPTLHSNLYKYKGPS